MSSNAHGGSLSLTHFLVLANTRGLAFDLSPVLSGNDPKKKAYLERWYEKARNGAKAGRIYPRYYIQNDRVMVTEPNLWMIPSELIRGAFKMVNAGPSEAYQFAKLRGEDALAEEFLDPEKRVGDILLRRMGISNATQEFRRNIKETFFRILYMDPAKVASLAGSSYDLFERNFPKLIGIPKEERERLLQTIRKSTLDLLALMAQDAETSNHRLVGFMLDQILVEGADEKAALALELSARNHLRNLCGAIIPTPPPLDPLQDCLQWLRDCGGVMALSNNPMGEQLIRAGYAKRGGWDAFGRVTLVLIEGK